MSRIFRRYLIAGTIFSFSPLSAHDDWSLNNHWAFLGDWLYLRRSKIEKHTLVNNSSKPQGDRSVMNTKDLLDDFSWESAVRAAITYTRNEKASLEALYIYVFPWEGKDSVEGNGTLSFPFRDSNFTQDYTAADAAHAKYRSHLQNAELNYWGHLTPRRVNYFSASWILGFRFMYLKENFQIAFQRRADKSDYDIQTKNLLYGAQLGGVFEINPSRRWTWTVQVKGAGFLNDARDKVFLGDENNSVKLRDFEKKRWAPAFLIEGIGSLTYQWFSHLNLHIGYQALLLTGLALAPEQRDKKASSRRYIDVEGDMVVDGFFAGLTLSF